MSSSKRKEKMAGNGPEKEAEGIPLVDAPFSDDPPIPRPRKSSPGRESSPPTYEDPKCLLENRTKPDLGSIQTTAEKRVPSTNASSNNIESRPGISLGSANSIPTAKTPKKNSSDFLGEQSSALTTVVVTTDPTADGQAADETAGKKKSHHEVTAIPQTNLAIGCLVTFCFNPLLGFMAIYCSLSAASAYRGGDNKKGASRARNSIILSLFGIMLTMVVVASLVVYFAADKHNSPKKLRSTGGAAGALGL